jgi:hypothetical protein
VCSVPNKKPVPRYRLLLSLVIVLVALLRHGWNSMEAPPVGQVTDAGIERVIQSRAGHTWVETGGSVIRLLPDDREGTAHQRFILRLASGRTVLVAHNIDLARRVPVQVGDAVRLRGRYEWNDKGGVVHWTHRDPGNSKVGGWIEFNTARYQ